MYVAVEDQILVYSSSINFIPGSIEPAEILVNPKRSRVTPQRYGPRPGPFDGESINILRAFTIIDGELLISGDGLGRIIIRSIDNLHNAIICYDVGSSVWGLDLRGHLLAASANSHQVYCIDLRNSSSSVSVEEQLREIRILAGPPSNIPCVSISEHDLIACVDINGTIHTWDLRNMTIGSKRSPICSTEGLRQWDMAWSCCYLPQSAFRRIQSNIIAPENRTEGVPNLVRSLYPKLFWWKAVGANVEIELDPEPDSHSSMNMLRAQYSLHRGIAPDQYFERCWQRSKLAEFQQFFTTTSVGNDNLLLITTTDLIYLYQANDLKKIHAICHYPFGSKFVNGHDLERINMVKALPECGLVAVATQRGQVCVLELVKCLQDERVSFSFRCHATEAATSVKDDSLVGLDFNRISDREARLAILHSSGRLRLLTIDLCYHDEDMTVDNLEL